MVSMKPIFRETAGTFLGTAFLYRLKEQSARWLTQLPATSPIPVVPSAQPLRAVPSGERRLLPKSKNNFVTGRACHSGLCRVSKSAQDRVISVTARLTSNSLRLITF